jgi:glycerate kinase
MGAGVVAFLNGHLRSGIQTMLELVQFDRTVEKADLIITGEGRIDGQSIRGKVVIGIAERASKLNIPVVAVVGDIGPDADLAYSMGVSSIFSTNRRAVPFSEARKTSREDLSATIDSILRFQRIFD